MSNRSLRRSVIARLAAGALACVVSYGCASAVGTVAKPAPPPPAKPQTTSNCQAQSQGGQQTNKDCAKTP